MRRRKPHPPPDPAPESQTWSLFFGGPWDAYLATTAPTAAQMTPLHRDPETGRIRENRQRYERETVRTRAGLIYIYRWPGLSLEAFAAAVLAWNNAQIGPAEPPRGYPYD